MIKKFLKAIFGFSVASGIFVFLGTAGSSDLCLIDFKTTLIRSAIGVALILIGYIGFRFINPAISVVE